MKEGFQGQQLLRVPQAAFSQTSNNELLSALQIQAIGFFPQARHHNIRRPKGMIGCKDHFLLNYCVGGRGWCEYEGIRYEVCPNQFFVLPMNKPHAYGSYTDDPWSVYWIRYNGSLSRYYSEGMAVPTTIAPGVTSRIGHRQEVFEEMYNTLDKGYTLQNMCYASSLLHVYLASLKYIQSYRAVHTRDRLESGYDVVQELIHYMEDHLEQRVTLQMMSEYSGYSVSQMSLIFHNETGYSPFSYFNVLKIKKSCWFLQNTNMKLNQICNKIGFDDPYYYSRLFKKVMGVSPQEFKEENC